MVERENAVSLRGISKTFGVVRALHEVDFDLFHGEVVGLVGENGAGKSTLINVLSGAIRPDAGHYELNGKEAPLGHPGRLGALGISVVTQEQTLAESLKVFENIFLGHEAHFRRRGLIQKRQMCGAAESLLESMGIHDVPANAVVGNLTYPKRQLVETARAFALSGLIKTRPIILLDEPTSGLSETEIELLFARIQEWCSKATFLFVSHQLRDVLRVSSRLYVLKDGQIVTCMANSGVTEKELHGLMVGRERSADYYDEREQAAAFADEPVMDLRSATVKSRFENVDLQVRPGEIVGLAGVIGSGKSEVAAALAGALPLDSGSVVVKGRELRSWSVPEAIRNGVLFVPPERALDSIFMTGTVASNISIGFLDACRRRRVPLLNSSTEKRIVEDLICKLSIKAHDRRVPIRELSGGNQQKAVFARWLARECVVLVVDDPTRGIDVGTREEIYKLLRQIVSQGTALVLCSESLEELIGLANRIVVLKDGRVTAEVAAPAGAKPSQVEIVQHMV